MQPVLVDGGKLVPQAAVEVLDDPCIALHDLFNPLLDPPPSRLLIWNCSNLVQNARNGKGGRGHLPSRNDKISDGD
jgi:hypothetical protein